VMNHHQTTPVTDLETVLAADGSARAMARGVIDNFSGAQVSAA